MSSEYYMALDVGTKRIGVATAHYIARLPAPLKTLEASANSIKEIMVLVQAEGVREVVVGLPRRLDGSSSSQTRYTETFAEKLRAALSVPVHMVDEALTSVEAETELAHRSHDKADIDALAACFILERWLEENNQVAIQ